MLVAYALWNSDATGAKAVEPPGQARWRRSLFASRENCKFPRQCQHEELLLSCRSPDGMPSNTRCESQPAESRLAGRQQ